MSAAGSRVLVAVAAVRTWMVSVLPGVSAFSPPTNVMVSFGAPDISATTVTWNTFLGGAAPPYAEPAVVRWGFAPGAILNSSPATCLNYSSHVVLCSSTLPPVSDVERLLYVQPAWGLSGPVVATKNPLHRDFSGCPRYVLFGDLGASNNQLLQSVQGAVARGEADALILFGDMVYWWGTSAGTVDSFVEAVANMTTSLAVVDPGVEPRPAASMPLSALPVMVSAGNERGRVLQFLGLPQSIQHAL